MREGTIHNSHPAVERRPDRGTGMAKKAADPRRVSGLELLLDPWTRPFFELGLYVGARQCMKSGGWRNLRQGVITGPWGRALLGGGHGDCQRCHSPRRVCLLSDDGKEGHPCADDCP